VIAALKERLTQLGPVGHSVCLAFVLLVALVVTLPIPMLANGSAGVWAAVLAGLVVWLASAAGIALGALVSGPGEAMVRMLIAMSIRMALPLTACVVVELTRGTLSAAGFVYFVLGFYLVALTVDTLLAVRGIHCKAAS